MSFRAGQRVRAISGGLIPESFPYLGAIGVIVDGSTADVPTPFGVLTHQCQLKNQRASSASWSAC